jgi:hypothetical protein
MLGISILIIKMMLFVMMMMIMIRDNDFEIAHNELMMINGDRFM